MSPPVESRGYQDQDRSILSDGGGPTNNWEKMENRYDGRKAFRKHHNDQSETDKRAELRECGMRSAKKMQPVRASFPND